MNEIKHNADEYPRVIQWPIDLVQNESITFRLFMISFESCLTIFAIKPHADKMGACKLGVDWSEDATFQSIPTSLYPVIHNHIPMDNITLEQEDLIFAFWNWDNQSWNDAHNFCNQHNSILPSVQRYSYGIIMKLFLTIYHG